MPDYRYTCNIAPDELGPCVYPVEDLDLSAHGLPGIVFTGDLHIDIDNSSGDDEWYIEYASAELPDGSYKVYKYTSNLVDAAVFDAIVKAACADQHRCDCIRDECREHA